MKDKLKIPFKYIFRGLNALSFLTRVIVSKIKKNRSQAKNEDKVVNKPVKKPRKTTRKKRKK